MTTFTLEASPPEAPAAPELQAYPSARLALGVLGRAWLWFLAGCLMVTLVPLLFGWHSYNVQTGSMEPKISPGDVVLVSPNASLDEIGGHVIAFDSPSKPGTVVTHRVVKIDDTGAITTRGDANQSDDSATITLDNVHGMGRLMVRWVGLPMIWTSHHEYIPLALFVLSLILAGLAVRADDDDPDAAAEAVALAAAAEEAERLQEPLAVDAPVDSWLRVDQISTWSAASLPGCLPRRVKPRSMVVLAIVVILGILAISIPVAMAAMVTQTTSLGSAWTVQNWNYATELTALNPTLFYRLDDTTGNSANDSSANNFDGTYSSTFTKGVAGATTTDNPNLAVTATNANSCIYTPNAAKITPGPTTYTNIAWIKTTAGYNQGGKIVGFESARTGISDSNNGGQYDRHIYMDGSGKVRFGVWLGVPFTLESTTALNDGAWHMVVSTMSTTTGTRLYVDGQLQDSSTNTSSEVFTNGGWFRFGCGNLSGWGLTTGANISWTGPNAPVAQANYAFRGSIDNVSVWQGTALTASQVAFLYASR